MNEQRVPLPIGRFQNFDILDVIGFGGSSLCYLVKRGHAFFILKELYPRVLSAELIRDGVRLIGNPENANDVMLNMAFFKEDFLLEAQISKDLVSYRRSEDLMGDNPYFFSLEDSFGIENSLSYYLVYQSKQGKTLSDYFKLSVENSSGRCIQVLSIMKQLAEAVLEVHDYGYLHLDLKLDNVYVIAYRSPVVVLLDLGSALKKEHIQENNIEHYIRRVSYAEQYSSLRLHSIFQKKRRLYQLLTLGYTSEQVRSQRDSIVNEISLLSESDDVYSLYVMLYELLTRTQMCERGQTKGFVESSQLDFLAVAVVEEIEKRILRGLNDEDRSMKQFIQDVDDIREFLMTEGIHPVLLKLKSEVQLNGRLNDLKFTVHPSIFTELETSASDKTIVYDDLVDYFQNQGSSHLVIVGEGGSGKSTQLMQLWKWLLDVRSTVVPFYISLIEYENRRFSHLVDYILHLYGGHFTENRRERLFQLFADSEGWQFVFLLDGFNEVANKEVLYGQIEELAQYPGVRLIMTSRYPYTGYLDHTTLNVKDLRKDQIEKFASELQVRFLADSDLHKRPMLLSLACRASHYLNEPLLSQSDLKKLDVRYSPYRMEMIADFFSAQKIKHYLNFHHRWDDVRVVLRMMAYDVVLPLVARFMFEKKSNSLDLDELVEMLMNHFDSKGETFFRSPLLKKIYKVNQILPSNLDFVYNHLINDLLSDELSLIKVSESVSFVSEVYQDYFLAFQMFREIAFPDDMDVPLVKNHRFSYEQLRSVGELLREYRFADPRVNSRGISYVELFLNRYRHIFDGSTGLLVKNAVELMRISRNGLIMADLSYLDLRQTKLTGSLFSTMGEIDCQPASFRGSHFSDNAFQTLEHRKAVDRIVVSDDARHVASYSSAEGMMKVWDLDDKEFVSKIRGRIEFSQFLDNRYLLNFDEESLYVHDFISGELTSSISLKTILSKYEFKQVELVKMMGSINDFVFLGIISIDETKEKYFSIIRFDMKFLDFSYDEICARMSIEYFSVYGMDKFTHSQNIFMFQENLFIIRLYHNVKHANWNYTKIELFDINGNVVIGSMYANIEKGATFFYLDTQQSLVFSVFSREKRLYSVVWWNLKNKSIKIVANHKRMFNILGICDVSGTIFKNAGYSIEAFRFVQSYKTQSNITYMIPETGYKYDDILSHKFNVIRGKSVLLIDSERVIAKIDNKTANIISSVQVYRDGNYVGMRFAENKVYFVFPRKMYVFDLSNYQLYKSVFERGSNNRMFGHESFDEREKFVQSASELVSSKKIFALNYESLYNTSKPMYSHRHDFETRFRTMVVSCNYVDDSTNRIFRLTMYDHFKKISKSDSLSKQNSELDLSDCLIGDEIISLIIQSRLFLMQVDKLIIVDIENLHASSYYHDMFENGHSNSDRKQRYLDRIHIFDYFEVQGSKCLLIVNNEELNLLQLDNTYLKTVLEVKNVSRACKSEKSLIVLDVEGTFWEYNVVNLIDSKSQSSHENHCSNGRRISEKGEFKGVFWDMRYYRGFIIMVTKEMVLKLWNYDKCHLEGHYEILDTNIIGCDFTDSSGTNIL